LLEEVQRAKEEVEGSNSSIGERKEGEKCQITCLKQKLLEVVFSVVKGKESEKREALSR